MSTTLNNFIKYSFTIRTSIQILYECRTRKAFDLLRINDSDSTISKTKIITIITCHVAKNVTIITYSVIIKSIVVENDSLVSRMSLFKVVIFVKSTTSVEEVIFFIKKITSRQSVTLSKITIVTSIAVMNEYRLSHIDIKNVIVFASLKMKKIYNIRYQLIFFKVEDFINLRLHKSYRVSIITSKKIKS